MKFVSRSTFTLAFAALFFVSTALTWAKPSDPLLVLDTENSAETPKRFRTTSDPLPLSNKINQSGLSELHISGSAQFSDLGLEQALLHIPAHKITIVDLRQESHGFLNGNAISWYGPQNAANADKTPAQVEEDQGKSLANVAESKKIDVNTILEKSSEGEISKSKSVEYKVHQVASEPEMTTKRHVNYYRLYVQDHHAPVASEVDKFIQLVNHLSKDEWLHFHCRAGKGRTTTFMALYDMMRNAKTVSFDDILDRQAALGGEDLRDVSGGDESYKRPFEIERLAFLKRFYQYARENQDEFKTLWSQWDKLASH